MPGTSYFADLNDSEIISTTAAIVVAMAKDPTLYEYVLSRLPTQSQLQEIHDLFTGNYSAVLAGNSEKIHDRDLNRDELNRKFAAFVGMVKLAAEFDPSLPQRLAIPQPPPKKKSHSSIHLVALSNFKVQHGEEHGVIIGKASGLRGARGFEIWGCQGDPTVEQNWRYMALSTKASRMEVRGLIPGTLYSFRARAIGPNGPGPWSSYATLMAI
jgi:hypothetical protein